MKLDIVHIDDKKAELVIEGVNPYFVNALRRTLLAEVPKLAIDEVTFYDNTSALFDEVIAHRLALLPIPTDPATLNLAGRVDDAGEPEYLVRYTLTKEGPCTVFSGDLEPEDKDFTLEDPQIPIVELLEGQRLILEAKAILGAGTQHAKWQVCSAIGYRYYPTAHIDNRKISAEVAQKIVETTPTGILSLDNGKIKIEQEARVHLANEAELLRNPDGINLADSGAFKIEYDDRKFCFQFETDGSLKAEDAMMKALELLKERFKALGDAVGKL